METERKKLLRLQSRRRGHLKAALRKYQGVFDMGHWFTRILKHPGADTPRELKEAGNVLQIEAGLTNNGYDAIPHKLKVAKFEQCGTSCCIAGLDFARTGRGLLKQIDFYGFASRGIYLPDMWPGTLHAEYWAAKNAGSTAGMVAAAEKAIDYFAIKE